MHRHHGTHYHHRHSAVKQGSLEGLLASIPVLAFLKKEDLKAVGDAVRGLWDDVKRQEGRAGSKFSMSAPVIVGAVVIGGAVAHGVWRGWKNAKHAGQREAEQQATPRYRENENERRRFSSKERGR